MLDIQSPSKGEHLWRSAVCNDDEPLPSSVEPEKTASLRKKMTSWGPDDGFALLSESGFHIT